MRKTLYSLAIIFVQIPVFGQSLDSLLISIQKNNHRLAAMEKWLEAEQSRARTGIYPDNPELSYVYMWGNSEAFGDQKELEVIQSFKFPGYYNSKADVQKQELVRKQMMVQKTRQELLHKVRTTFFNVVWLEKKSELLQARSQESEKLVNIMESGFQSGEISKPVFDRARILNISLRNELSQRLTNIEVQKDLLQQMNGDLQVGNISFEYPEHWGLPDLDSVLVLASDQNADLKMAGAFVEENELNVKLEKMNSLPEFQAGYKSQAFLNQKLKGVHAGVTIPLWQNKNQVKQAKLETEWSQATAKQVESVVRSEITTLYNNLETAYKNYLELKEILGEEQVSENSLDLLQAGQISFPEYLMEIQFIFDSQNKYLEIEKRYFDLMSELFLKTAV
jgi:outer membrane protein TolC